MTEKETSFHIVPSGPNWFVAIFVEGKGCSPDEIILEPIVAWEIEREKGPYAPMANRPGETWTWHWLTPLTLSGNQENSANKWAFKRPDGKYEIQEHMTFDSEEELIAEFRNMLAAECKFQVEREARARARAK